MWTGPTGSSACVENKFGAFIVEVKHGVEVAVAEENLSFKLQGEVCQCDFSTRSSKFRR